MMSDVMKSDCLIFSSDLCPFSSGNGTDEHAEKISNQAFSEPTKVTKKEGQLSQIF